MPTLETTVDKIVKLCASGSFNEAGLLYKATTNNLKRFEAASLNDALKEVLVREDIIELVSVLTVQEQQLSSST